jgi:hypothetical protein
MIKKIYSLNFFSVVLKKVYIFVISKYKYLQIYTWLQKNLWYYNYKIILINDKQFTNKWEK